MDAAGSVSRQLQVGNAKAKVKADATAAIAEADASQEITSMPGNEKWHPVTEQRVEQQVARRPLRLLRPFYFALHFITNFFPFFADFFSASLLYPASAVQGYISFVEM